MRAVEVAGFPSYEVTDDGLVRAKKGIGMSAPRRIFHAEPAVRKAVPLLVGVMGPSGSGKTYSALRLATGMQRVLGGEIYGIDTESNRMLHYADQFKFQHVPFSPPFGSLDYLEAVRWCSKQGAKVILVDSQTHEHIGEGGYLETAEEVVNRMAGDDYRKREAVKMLGWAKAGPLRQKMIEGMKQLSGAFIFCFRAKEKTKPVRKQDGKTEIVDMGFMPIAGEEWLYEMTVNCLLEPRSDGVPTWRSDFVGERLMMKLPAQFKNVFAERSPLSEDIGEKLAQWAMGSGWAAASTSGNFQVPKVKPGHENDPVDLSATNFTLLGNGPLKRSVTEPENRRAGSDPVSTNAPEIAADSTPPPTPTALPAGEPNAAHTATPAGIDESERIDRLDASLAAAAEGGFEALRYSWSLLAPADQKILKAALDRRHKPAAIAVDANARS